MDTKQILILSCLLISSLNISAQSYDTDVIYDFSHNQDTLNSEISFTYADSGQIIVAGQLQKENETSQGYIAAFNYDGSIIWEKSIPTPGSSKHSIVSGFNNLKKLNTGNFVVGGEVTDTMVRPGNTITHSFLYFFNESGDSVNYVQMTDSFQSRYLNVVMIDLNDHIIIGGTRDSKEYSEFSIGKDSVVAATTFWFAKYSSDGVLILEHETDDSS